jgi:competence protein ComGF
MKKHYNYVNSFTLFEVVLALFLLAIILSHSLNLIQTNYDDKYRSLLQAQNSYIKMGLIDTALGFKP